MRKVAFVNSEQLFILYKEGEEGSFYSRVVGRQKIVIVDVKEINNFFRNLEGRERVQVIFKIFFNFLYNNFKKY